MSPTRGKSSARDQAAEANRLVPGDLALEAERASPGRPEQDISGKTWVELAHVRGGDLVHEHVPAAGEEEPAVRADVRALDLRLRIDHLLAEPGLVAPQLGQEERRRAGPDHGRDQPVERVVTARRRALELREGHAEPRASLCFGTRARRAQTVRLRRIARNGQSVATR